MARTTAFRSGLSASGVAATEDGTEVARVEPSKPLVRRLRRAFEPKQRRDYRDVGTGGTGGPSSSQRARTTTRAKRQPSAVRS